MLRAVWAVTASFGCAWWSSGKNFLLSVSVSVSVLVLVVKPVPQVLQAAASVRVSSSAGFRKARISESAACRERRAGLRV